MVEVVGNCYRTLVEVNDFSLKLTSCRDKLLLALLDKLFRKFKPVFLNSVRETAVARVYDKLLQVVFSLSDIVNTFQSSFSNGYVAVERREKEIVWSGEDYMANAIVKFYFADFHNSKSLVNNRTSHDCSIMESFAVTSQANGMQRNFQSCTP